MTNNLSVNQEIGDLLFYQREDGLTRIVGYFEKRMKKQEQMESKISKTQFLKKKKGDVG